MPHRQQIARPFGGNLSEPATIRNDPKAECEARGWIWDEEAHTCNNPDVQPVPTPTQTPQPQPTTPSPPGSAVINSETGRPAGFINSEGNFVSAGREDIQNVVSKQAAQTAPIEGGITTEQFASQQQGQQLTGQIGQFDPLGVDATGLDFGQAATQGAIGSIPSAIRTAGSLAILGAAGGSAAGPVGAVGGAAIGGAVGFVAGITGGMISDLKGQRSDTTTAQQRVLDEGKQTMKDWASWAEADPANKEIYLAEFNKVSAQIDQAYRQMKLDTSRDSAKFETALPNLAEFEAFYAAGGERDELENDMRFSLTTPANIDNTILQLVNRRGDGN